MNPAAHPLVVSRYRDGACSVIVRSLRLPSPAAGHLGVGGPVHCRQHPRTGPGEATSPEEGERAPPQRRSPKTTAQSRLMLTTVHPSDRACSRERSAPVT
jgi:hypothetical protein